MVEYRDDYSRKLLRDAKICLDTAREFEKTEETVWEDFIIGKSTFAVISRNPETGRPEHNIWAVMETIYDDYRKNPQKRIDLKLQEVLGKTLLTETNPVYLKNAIEELLYQLRSEKNSYSPFKLNCVELLSNLKTNVSSNRKKFELSNMLRDLESYDEFLQKNYDSSFMI